MYIDRHTRCCGRHGRRCALTLIEVVAALVIMGSAVTTILVAQANAVQVVAESKFDLEACERATNLIASWRVSGADITREAKGGFDSAPNWSWRRTVAPWQGPSKRKFVQVALELRWRDSKLWTERATSYSWLVSAKHANPEGL